MNRLSLLLVATVWMCNVSSAIAANIQVVYLSPADKPYRPEYESALTQAVGELQSWFASELDGYTFSTPTDAVSWYQLPNTTSWYQNNPVSRPAEIRFWESVLGDAFAATGGRFNDPQNRWLYYVDADILSGQLVGGTSGVALFPANDLRGLNGESLVAINPGDSTVNLGLVRRIGGMGHELGHALGLNHPTDSPGGPDDRSLMYLGYLDFPNTYLSLAEKQSLLTSSFFESVDGDFDFDGDRDGADFLLWQKGGSPNPLSADDLATWKTNFGSTEMGVFANSTPIPEPHTGFLFGLGVLVLICGTMSRTPLVRG